MYYDYASVYDATIRFVTASILLQQTLEICNGSRCSCVTFQAYQSFLDNLSSSYSLIILLPSDDEYAE